MSVQVSPAKVELSSTGDATATVLVSNAGKVPVFGLKVKPVLTGSSLTEATVKPSTKRGMLAGETGVYELTLGPWAQTPPLSTVTLLVTYLTKPEKGKAIQQAVTGTVELLPPAPLEIDKVATVEIKASLGSLHTDETEPVYLLVHNKAAYPLTVEKVVAQKPDFIDIPEIEKGGSWEPVTVAPGETSVLTLKAEADSEVNPGEHQLVIRLPSKLGNTRFDLVGAQTATVGVSGESDLLTVFGIPSLLFLPGLLVLVTASILWESRLGRKEWDEAKFPLPAKEPQFWLIAVLISTLIVLPAKSFSIDLLGEYGLVDLAILWLSSMALGLIGWLLAVVSRNLYRASRVPAASDKAIDIVEKLGKQKLDLKRPQLMLDVEGMQSRHFLVQPESETRPSTWTSPPIGYAWQQGKRDAPLDQRIQKLLNGSRDAGKLAEALRDGLRRDLLTVFFDGKPNAPTLVEKAKIANPVPMVMVEEKVR